MNITFYFSTSKDQMPFIEPTYNASYKRLSEFASLREIDIRFVFGKENYEDGQFKSYWKFKQEELVQNNHPFRPDLVVVQTREHPHFKNRVNNELLEGICRDKFKTSQTFPEYSKQTIILNENAKQEIKNFNTDLVTIKPRYGALGEDINFIKKDEFENHQYKGEYIAQEFIDSKEGIPGLVNQRHELRLFIFSGVIKAAYLRIPKQDSYLSNIAQGAIAKQINLFEIPETVIELKNIVDNKFMTVKPRLYTIDVMFENKKPWIVELNDMPGMPDISVQPLTDTFLKAMLDLFKNR